MPGEKEEETDQKAVSRKDDGSGKKLLVARLTFWKSGQTTAVHLCTNSVFLGNEKQIICELSNRRVKSIEEKRKDSFIWLSHSPRQKFLYLFIIVS